MKSQHTAPTFLAKDGASKQCLSPKPCWHPRPGIEPATLSSADQRAANRATEAGWKSRASKFLRAPKKVGVLAHDLKTSGCLCVLLTAGIIETAERWWCSPRVAGSSPSLAGFFGSYHVVVCQRFDCRLLVVPFTVFLSP